AMPQPLDLDRLAKLLAMLSSPNDGEVLNTARLMARMFEEAGTDIVTVAMRIVGARVRRVPRLLTISGTTCRSVGSAKHLPLHLHLPLMSRHGFNSRWHHSALR